MDSIFEKFSLHDFFNLVICGAVFVLSLDIIDISLLSFLHSKINILNNEISYFVTTLLIFYMVGYVLQGIGLVIEEKKLKIQKSMTGTILLDNNNVIINSEKLKIYQEKAKQLFIMKNVKIKGNKFSQDQCEYFFSYCNYFIEVKGYNKKTEKLRGLKALSNLWIICFSLLSLIGVIKIFFLLLTEFSFLLMIRLAFFTGISLLLSISSIYRMKSDIKRWIRMILGIYEVCSDLT